MPHSADQDNIARYALDNIPLDEQKAFEIRMAEDDEMALWVPESLAP